MTDLLLLALALLLIHAGQAVSTDALAEAMWGDQGRARSATTLDSHVWRLRKLLEPERAPGSLRPSGSDEGGGTTASRATLAAPRSRTTASRTSKGWGAYVDGVERVEFTQRLGFVQNPAITELPVGESGFSASVSSEQLEVLDADVVVVFPIGVPPDEVRADPVFQAVPAVAAGRALVLDPDVSSAYSLSSVLSTQWALDRMVPLLEGLGELS